MSSIWLYEWVESCHSHFILYHFLFLFSFYKFNLEFMKSAKHVEDRTEITITKENSKSQSYKTKLKISNIVSILHEQTTRLIKKKRKFMQQQISANQPLSTRVRNRDHQRAKRAQSTREDDDSEGGGVRARIQDARRDWARVATKRGASFLAFQGPMPVHPLRVPFPLVITDANSVSERLGTATNWSFNSTTLASASYYFPFPPATSLSFHPNCFDVREPLHVVVGLSIFWVQLKSSLAWLPFSLSFSLLIFCFLFLNLLFVYSSFRQVSLSLSFCLVSSSSPRAVNRVATDSLHRDRQCSSGTVEVAPGVSAENFQR